MDEAKLRSVVSKIIEAKPRDFTAIVTNLEAEVKQQKTVYDAALAQIQFDFGAVYQDEVLAAEATFDGKSSFSVRLQSIKTALMGALKTRTTAVPTTTVWTSGLRPRAVPLKPVEVVEGVVLSEPAPVPETDAPYSGLALEPADPGVELLAPEVMEAEEEKVAASVVAHKQPEVFTIETTPVVKDVADRWSATVQKLSVIEPAPGLESDSAEAQVTPDMVTEYLQKYPGGELARADAFENWVDNVQGKHPSRFVRAFNILRHTEHPDAFEGLKNMRLGDIREIIRMPESARLSKLHQLNIEPADFETWRRFLAAASMIPDIKRHTSDSGTFGSFAEYVFAYDALQAG